MHLLKRLEPFAKGGNRLCFIHPLDSSKCIKVRRPDFTLEDRRKKKGFPKNLKPLSSFDDNLAEYRIMSDIDRRLGPSVYHYISRCYGFEDTDMGKGLVSELILDASHYVSHTLKQYIWDNGYTDECRRAVDEFCAGWEALRIPSHDLLLHNIVVNVGDSGEIKRLVMIDGLGKSAWFSESLTFDRILQKRYRKKTDKLRAHIDELLVLRAEGGQFPGYHGQLLKEDLIISPSDGEE